MLLQRKKGKKFYMLAMWIQQLGTKGRVEVFIELRRDSCGMELSRM